MNLRAKLHRFTYYLFPGQCILCKNLTYRQLDICLACESDLPWLRNCCPYCAEPSADILPCARCLQKPPSFSATLSGFEYRFPIDVLIHAFKDSQHLSSGYVLTHLAYGRHRQTLRNISGQDLLVVPVPLHPRKSRARGFNQSHLIAQQLADLIPAKLDQTLLYRVIDTPDQKSLPLASRKHNLKDSFRVKRDLKGDRILLVDDVVTTGTTITEISDCLIQSGASDVVVFAVARTPPSQPIVPGLLQ
ncbi:MAG: ComF family protein [Gammaproteobacteria bacterium]|nr:ComF family protein [Gammaproteobacteria bacterium]MBT3868465.1 ComF family protein [Gammaproteobacteria bacterium]MBT4380770.1 ComF family protein [Gammaproteobacteria bacterium]MBT4615233.1 ComF family protein [Gammaproteobacteria bacterium]MBT5199183.1 ComF family protein [Gammaproteobacteria bacterium]